MATKENTAPLRGNISTQFLYALKSGGSYAAILEAAKADKELDIQVRDNYLNIYYRGGNILKIGPSSLVFDKFYFYLRTPDFDYPKTYVEKAAKGIPPEEISKINPVPFQDESIDMIIRLEKETSKLMSLLPYKPADYFTHAKEIMKAWFERYPKGERGKQHEISLANRMFTDENNLVVIDLEFAVSIRKVYNKAINSKGNPKVCRFDIIAVSSDGQLYVIELKDNPDADKEGSFSDVKHHKDDFDNTIGNDTEGKFLDEMVQVLDVKKKLGIITDDVFIDKTKKPKFAILYSGEDGKEAFCLKHGCLQIIKMDNNKKLSL